mmetsp:Transcript_870/g.2192  ORF Transcript_870/g.2192 Transcript_870/m.2192 type:complete len:284 (-) Transcript_870:1702-2553(-)
MVIRGCLGNIPRKLRNFHLLLVKILFHARKQDFPLRRFHSIHDSGDGTDDIGPRELKHFVVEKIREIDDSIVGQFFFRILAVQPILTLLSAVTPEHHVNQVRRAFGPLECRAMVVNVPKIFLPLFPSTRSETLVVLERCSLESRRIQCFLVLLHRFQVVKRSNTQLRVDRFYNGCGEGLEEGVRLEQLRPEMMEEVHHQSLDVMPVMILIGHEHDLVVAQSRSLLGLTVVSSIFQAEYTHDICKFLTMGTKSQRRGLISPPFQSPAWATQPSRTAPHFSLQFS